MEKQEVTFDYGKSEGSHEVYLVLDTETNTLLYIGHGASGRHKHTYSGISHVYGLNYEHFKGTPVNIRVVAFGEKEVASLVESYLISKLRPKYNKVGLVKSHQSLEDLQKIIDELVATSKGFYELTSLLSLEQEDFKDTSRERLSSGKKPSTKDLIQAFKTDPELVKEVDEDLYSWLSLIGVEKAEALQSKRGAIKMAYEKRLSNSQYMNKTMLKSWFRVGVAYSPDTLREKVETRTQQKCRSTHEALKVIRKYYEVASTTRHGKSAYKIVRIL